MDTTANIDLKAPRSWVWLFVILVVVVGASWLIGALFGADEWYRSLEKPPFNPPDWVFAPVWTTLYVLIAIAGWLVFMKAPQSLAMKLWVAQMLVNWAWSPIWFRLHQIWVAFAVILLMLTLIIAFMVAARRLDWRASALFLPYAAWVSFATVLNLSIGLLN